jgi:hypothetical protein
MGRDQILMTPVLVTQKGCKIASFFVGIMPRATWLFYVPTSRLCEQNDLIKLHDES